MINLQITMNGILRNNVLRSLAKLIADQREEILAANRLDVAVCATNDEVILDRLKVDAAKITGSGWQNDFNIYSRRRIEDRKPHRTVWNDPDNL